jgi:GLPGLI family protein
MKKLVISALISLGLGVATVSAQMSMGSLPPPPGEDSKKAAIDKVQFNVQYELSFIQDVSNPDQISEETMILKVGEKTSEFYSYSKFVADSLLRIQMAQSGGFIRREMQGGSGARGQVTYQIYKNHPAGKVTTLDQVGPSRFRVEETNVCPEWELTSDTTTMLSYLCYKATTRFKGRDYTVWFTPAIPRSEGPWKLCGLPGLILYAEDSQKHFVFECTGLRNALPDETIQYGADNYEPISRTVLNRNMERFAADPVTYITSSNPNIQVMMRNQDGSNTNPRNIPYNPIELSE